MNPLVSSFIGAGVRWLLVVLAARTGAQLSEDETTQIVMGVLTVLPLGWSWWQKYQADRALETAKLQTWARSRDCA